MSSSFCILAFLRHRALLPLSPPQAATGTRHACLRLQLAGAYSPRAREAENYNGLNLKATTRAKGKHLVHHLVLWIGKVTEGVSFRGHSGGGGGKSVDGTLWRSYCTL